MNDVPSGDSDRESIKSVMQGALIEEEKGHSEHFIDYYSHEVEIPVVKEVEEVIHVEAPPYI